MLALIGAILAGCSGYDCEAAEEDIRRQAQLVLPLIDDLVATSTPTNGCDSGDGGYTSAQTVPGVTIEQVARRFTAKGWKSRENRAGNRGSVVLSGVVDDHPFQVYVDRRPPDSEVVEVDIQSGG